MNVTDPRHEFVRVESGTPLERVYLRSSIMIDGKSIYSQIEFPFSCQPEIMAQLDFCEEVLSRVVGSKIVKGENP